LSDLARGFIGDFHVSPDGRWLALTHEKLNNGKGVVKDMLITTSNAQTLKTIPWDETNWSNLTLDWLSDNQRLLIVPREGVDQIVVFNPFTSEEQRITPTFQYTSDSPLPDEAWGPGNVAYDPTLSRVVYLDNSTTMVLWDVTKKQALWRLKDMYAGAQFPKWSPDGEYVAIVTSAQDEKNELSLVGRNGDKRISVLVADVPADQFTFNWSSNGRYLAYWAPSAQGEGERLMVFDRTTQERFDTCIQPLPDPTFTSVITWPIWSPTSQQFIIGFSEPRIDVNAKWVYHNWIVDVEQRRIFPLEAMTWEPVAWIKSEP
jgi:Tol biopolymer transport system component